MKIIVISDSHGNIANLKHVLGFAKKIKAGGIIHCGDWDNVAAVNAVLSFKLPLYAVLGNADVNPEIGKRLRMKGKRFDEDFLEFEINNKKIGVIHSFNYLISNIEYLNILFCGHRHFRGEKIIDGVKVVYPGALHSIKPSFVVYDTTTNDVEFVDLSNG